MFTIRHDPRSNLLTIHVEGFWKPDDVGAFAKAVGAKAHQVRAITGDFDVLIESLDFPVQAHDVADLLTSVMRAGTSLTTGHVAVVVGSGLNRLQAERTLVHPRLRVFMVVEAGMGWLTSTRLGATAE